MLRTVSKYPKKRRRAHFSNVESKLSMRENLRPHMEGETEKHEEEQRGWTGFLLVK